MGKRIWHTIEDGGSDRWVYVREIEKHHRYHVITVDIVEPERWESWDAPDRFYCDLAEVNLSTIDLHGVMSSCGISPEEVLTSPMWLASSARWYGAYSPLWSDGPKRGRRGMERTAKRESATLLVDHEAYTGRMNRVVNGIGQTAREYGMTGTLVDAITRGVAKGDPKATLMAKMYGASNGQTLGGTLAGFDRLVSVD